MTSNTLFGNTNACIKINDKRFRSRAIVTTTTRYNLKGLRTPPWGSPRTENNTLLKRIFQCNFGIEWTGKKVTGILCSGRFKLSCKTVVIIRTVSLLGCHLVLSIVKFTLMLNVSSSTVFFKNV